MFGRGRARRIRLCRVQSVLWSPSSLPSPCESCAVIIRCQCSILARFGAAWTYPVVIVVAVASSVHASVSKRRTIRALNFSGDGFKFKTRKTCPCERLSSCSWPPWECPPSHADRLPQRWVWICHREHASGSCTLSNDLMILYHVYYVYLLRRLRAHRVC